MTCDENCRAAPFFLSFCIAMVAAWYYSIYDSIMFSQHGFIVLFCFLLNLLQYEKFQSFI